MHCRIRMASNNPNQIKSTRTAFRIIRCLDKNQTMTITEIADRIGFSKSAVHKHLSTLESLGYIRQGDDGYQLGYGFLALGRSVRKKSSLYQAAQPAVERLSTRTGETALLLGVDGTKGAYLQIASDREKTPDIRLGTQIDLYSSAPGQAILAYLPRDRVQAIINEVNFPITIKGTSVDELELHERLETIRDRGLAFEWSTDNDGWQSATGPITNENSHAVGSVTVLGPPSRVDGKRLEVDIRGSVLSTAEKIEKSLVTD